jgi:nicotinamidase-related amidase
MAGDVLVVVDMQVGLLDGPPKHELDRVVIRINSLADHVRHQAGKVVWIRHCGKAGDGFEPGTPGWAFLPELDHRSDDLVVDKTLNDAFAGTSLHASLQRIAPDRLVITGWATDFCVDATVRSAVSHDYHVVVAADAHTVSDRPHLAAADVIRHHNWVWSGLLTNRTIRVMRAANFEFEDR